MALNDLRSEFERLKGGFAGSDASIQVVLDVDRVIGDALESIKLGFAKKLKEHQKREQQYKNEIERLVQEKARIVEEREKETESARLLSDAFAREAEKVERKDRDLEAARQEIANLSEQLEKEKGHIVTASSLAKGSETEKELLEEELQRMRVEMEQKDLQIAEKEDQVQELQFELSMQQPKVEELRKNLLEEKVRSKDLEERVQRLESRLSESRLSVVAESEASSEAGFDLQEQVRLNIDFFGAGAWKNEPPSSKPATLSNTKSEAP